MTASAPTAKSQSSPSSPSRESWSSSQTPFSPRTVLGKKRHQNMLDRQHRCYPLPQGKGVRFLFPRRATEDKSHPLPSRRRRRAGGGKGRVVATELGTQKS